MDAKRSQEENTSCSRTLAAVAGLGVFRAAIYVDKILKGAQSVEQPTKVGRVINLRRKSRFHEVQEGAQKRCARVFPSRAPRSVPAAVRQ
jgi:hypothetical protein